MAFEIENGILKKYQSEAGETEVVIPNGVTEIGEFAFWNYSSITRITLPNGVIHIGNQAFRGCSALALIVLPGSLMTIGNRAFEYCVSLAKIKIPDSVTSIGESAFFYCKKLEKMSLPDSMTSLSAKTFYLCDNLVQILLPNSVTSIGDEAFMYCSAITQIILPDSLTIIGNGAFENCSSLSQITIPDNVTSIGEGVFIQCIKLKQIKLPNKMKSLSAKTFYSCNNLVQILLPDSVTSIGNQAFGGCSALTQIVLPESLTTIGNGAFEFCDSLTQITIPDCVTSIGYGAFRHCGGLRQIVLPKTVTDISPYLFSDCRSLQHVSLPDGIMSIGEGAFSYCPRLEQITLPDSVTHIGKGAFNNCDALSEINIPESLKNTESKKFVIENGILKDFLGWGIETEIVIPDGVTIIAREAFAGCHNLTRITIPDGITEIGWNTFRSCESLTGIQLPASIKKIGHDAFEDVGTKIRNAGGKFEAIVPEELKPLLKGTGLMGQKGIHTKFISNVLKPKPVKKKTQNIELSADAEIIAAWVANQKYFALMQKEFPTDKMPKIKLINNKPAPVETLQFIAYSYLKSVKDMPAANKANYRTAVGSALFVPNADKLAELLDRDSLCEALSSLTFDEIFYVDDGKIKAPLREKVMGKERDLPFSEWYDYFMLHLGFPAAVEDPFWESCVHALCRYGDEKMIDRVCKWINHFLMYDLFELKGRKNAVIGRTALLLSDTRRAAMYLDKCGALKEYAKMRGKTEAEIRDGFASALGFEADGTVSLDDED